MSERNTMPLCCCVSPLHSSASTGSDTVGNPTSTTSCAPRAQTARQFGRLAATDADNPSIRITRTCGVGGSCTPLLGGSSTGALGIASNDSTAWIQRCRARGAIHATIESTITITSARARRPRLRPGCGSGALVTTGIIPHLAIGAVWCRREARFVGLPGRVHVHAATLGTDLGRRLVQRDDRERAERARDPRPDRHRGRLDDEPAGDGAALSVLGCVRPNL